jgi:hypothetical protein
LTTAGTANRALAIFALSIASLLIWVSAAAADAPDNDDFADAIPLSSALPISQSGSNSEATKEAGEPDHAGDTGGHSVWYSWTPSSSGPVGVKAGSCFGLEAVVGVYTGSSVSALTPVASSVSPTSGGCFSFETAPAEFEALAGTTYWIAVDGKGGAQNGFDLQLGGPSENDDFADATVIAGDPPALVSGTTRLNGKEAGEPDHAGDPGGHSVWFSWTPGESGPVAIGTCSPFSNLDSVLAVYTGAALNALTPVASNDDGSANVPMECSWLDSEVVVDVTAGTTYRIAIDGANGGVGRFNLRIRGRPENDDFTDAQVLNPVFPTGVQGTNRFATDEAGEPEHGLAAGAGSVWYSWTPSSSGSVAISTCTHEGLDARLAVYSGASLGALSLIAAGDDMARRCDAQDAEVRFPVTAGTTYRIAVDGKEGSEGSFYLNVEGPPANDFFANAKAITPGLPVSDFGSTRFGSKEAGEPNHAGNGGGDSVWFSWTPSSSGPVAISVCPYGDVGPDTLLGVYTGSAVDGLTKVAANDDSSAACRDIGSEVEIDAVAGTTYRIAVDGKDGSEGIFSLELNGRPANDDFGSAQELPAYPITAGAWTTFAAKEAGEPDHAGDPGGHSVWFSWTPSADTPIEITACGQHAGVDPLLSIYTGSSLGSLTPVAGSDDAGTGLPDERCGLATDSDVRFQASAGTTYRIAVDTKNGEGRVGLGFIFGPANDDFAQAQELSGPLPLFGAPLTTMATKEAGEPDHAGDTGGHSVWYSWTPEESGPITLSTCTRSGDLDALLAVYTGSSLAGLTPVADADDGSTEKGCRATDGELDLNVVAGTTYRIAIDGKADTSGLVQLIAEEPARNDDFLAAQPLGGAASTQGFVSNRFASKETGEPDHAGEAGGSSVWFKWSAPRSGEFSIDTCESGFDTLLAVYTGGAVGGLVPVGSNDDGSGKCGPQSKLTFNAVANTVYRIAVDGKGGAEGPIWLHLDSPPANDDFDQPSVIAASPGWWFPGSTMLATREAGEPNHAGDAGGHSVWVSWTPAKTAEVELDICTSSFEPVLAVYEGDDLGGLTPVPTTDAGSGECDEGESLGFAAHADTTYRIAVDGAAGDAGHFELHLRPVAPILHSLSVDKAGNGAGSVTARRGIDCGPSCSHEFLEGTPVTLTATPAAGSTFVGWSGGGCSGTAPCEINLKDDTAVAAVFQAPVSGGGGGGTVPPVAGPVPGPVPKKPLKCKRGFKKKLVKGKPRCVKKKKTKGKRRRGGTR